MSLGAFSTARTNRWAITNIKGLATADLPLSGTNFICGPNSSGKSSLIQSLLLLAQSSQTEILLNGTIVRLGLADDLINESAETATFEWTFRPRRRRKLSTSNSSPVTARMTLSKLKKTSESKAGNSTVGVSAIELLDNGKQIFQATSDRVDQKTIQKNDPELIWGNTLLRVKLAGGQRAKGRTFVALDGFYPRHFIFPASSQRISSSLKKTLNHKVIGNHDSVEFFLEDALYNLYSNSRRRTDAHQDIGDAEDAVSSIFNINDTARTDSLEPSLDMLEPHIEKLSSVVSYNGIAVLSSMEFLDLGRISGGAGSLTSLLLSRDEAFNWLILGEAFEALSSLSKSIRYIGPLREEPKVVSTTGGRSETAPVGVRGEYTADYLLRNSNTTVQFVNPYGEEEEAELKNAVGAWSDWLGLGDSVDVVDRNKLGRGITISLNGKPRDLTTIGVGVSQLLPVITLVLGTSPGSVILLEQPELHLHPAIQAKLANFFIEARPDVSIVVETHSEYMITRARRLLVDRTATEGSTEFLFVTPGERGNHLEKLPQGPLGDITVWPEGFFDTQHEEERALLFAIKRRSKEAGHGSNN